MMDHFCNFVQVCFLSDLFILFSILNNSWKCRCIKIGKLFQKMISTNCDSAVLQNSLSLTYFFYFYSFPFKYIVRFFMWVMVLSTLPITFSVFPVGKTFFSMNDSFSGSNYVSTLQIQLPQENGFWDY